MHGDPPEKIRAKIRDLSERRETLGPAADAVWRSRLRHCA